MTPNYLKHPKLNLMMLATVCGVNVANAQNSVDKPNVILIMCDDLGWGDVGFNGNKVIKTPHLDRMAADGLQLNRFYSACAVSSPTRFSCLTGRNPFRSGIFGANEGILRPEEITITELLKDEGYKTGHFGKWHLGTLTHTQSDANRARVGNIKEYNPPSQHGYDVAFVTESKVPTWDPMKAPAIENVPATGWNYIKEGEASKPYGTYYWDIDGNMVTDNLGGDNSRVIMDRVIPFIDDSDENPFFAVVWFHTPHKPCVAGPEHAAMYEQYSEDFKNYAGCVTAMDEQIGRLRSFLKEKGLDENTMIWFCSDNGPENCAENGGGVTGGFKGRKRSLYEGGVRVPSLVVWPAVVKQGRKSDFPSVTNDYLPTIASAVGIASENLKYKIDGINLMPLLEGNVKKRDKAIVLINAGQATYTDNDYKLYIKNEIQELYNIKKDPFEQNPITDPAMLNDYITKLKSEIGDYERSFKGEEYGTESYTRMGQNWEQQSKVDYLSE